MSDDQPSSQQEEQLAAVQEGDVAAADSETSRDANMKEQEETDPETREQVQAEQDAEGGEGGGRESDGEEGKGVKRKREEAYREEEAGQSTEKKKVKKKM